VFWGWHSWTGLIASGLFSMNSHGCTQNKQTQKRALEQARLDYCVTAFAAISLAVAIGCPHTTSGISVYLLRSAGTLFTRNFQFAPQIPTTFAYVNARRKNTAGNSFYIVRQQGKYTALFIILDFKLSPCVEYCVYSFGYFPGVKFW
jgi:hypothetical protein